MAHHDHPCRRRPRPENGTGRSRPRSIAPLVSGDLTLRRVRVHPREVVFLKGVLEASEGLAVMFAEDGGELTIATTASQSRELDRTLRDLQDEVPALVEAEGTTSAQDG